MTGKNTIETKIAIFRGKKIRKTIYKNEWWFSVIDVIEALVGTDRPRKYWHDLKKELKKQGYKNVTLLGQNVNSYGSDLIINSKGKNQK